MKPPIIMLSLLACVAGCGQSSDHVGGLTDEAFDDLSRVSSSMQNTIALTAPLQPELSVRGTAQTLTFEWQVRNDTQFANLYVFDSKTLEERLIAGNIEAATTSLSIPSHTAMRHWHAEQFRLELCDDEACVSSSRKSVSSLAASTVQIIRPSVFLQSEQFASSVTSNSNASMVAVTRPVEGTVQIYLLDKTRWIATEPMSIVSGAEYLITDIASSGNGDKLAILVAPLETSAPASIHVLVRLGEAWFDIEQVALPEQILIDSDSTISLSADGTHLLVHARSKTLGLYRAQEKWRPYNTLSGISTDHYVAVSASRNFFYRHSVQRLSEQLWLVSHRRVGGTQALPEKTVQDQPELPTKKQLLMESGTDPEIFAWQEFNRIPIQGLNVNEEVILKSHTNGSAVVIAGWDNTHQSGQRTPVMWRYDVHKPQPGTFESTTVNARDSLRSRPTLDRNARLRFDSSDTLEHVALGWQSQAGDDAQLSTFTFNAAQQHWQVRLELPADMSTLAKQGFAEQIALSADGQTLFVTVPSGSSSSVENRVGELMVFR